MTKKIVFSCIALLVGLTVFGQAEEDNGTNKFFFGGNIGLQFGNITFVEVSPTFGYHITPKFSAGAGIVFQYVRYNANVYGEELSTSVAGSKFFGRYLVWENLFLTAETQLLSVASYRADIYGQLTKFRTLVPVMFVGGGYQQPIGEKSFVTISLLYDVIDEPYSPYSNPYIGIGINIRP